MSEEYDDLPDRYFRKESRATKVESVRLPTSFPSRAGGGKRRGMKDVAPVSRDYIRMLVDKFDTIQYGESIRGGLSPEEQRHRNKALTSLLYLSARRVSEIVGRKYKGDIHKGVMVSDFREDQLDGQDVLILNCRILKKWNRKRDVAKIHYGDVIMDMADEPFMGHILSWLERQKEEGETKYISLGRNRAYKILHELSPKIVGPHWFRHMRLSHLAETLTIYELKAKVGFWESIEPAIAYVHGKTSKYLEACRRARGIKASTKN
jgi:hypothetical protein